MILNAKKHLFVSTKNSYSISTRSCQINDEKYKNVVQFNMLKLLNKSDKFWTNECCTLKTLNKERELHKRFYVLKFYRNVI